MINIEKATKKYRIHTLHWSASERSTSVDADPSRKKRPNVSFSRHMSLIALDVLPVSFLEWTNTSTWEENGSLLQGLKQNFDSQFIHFLWWQVWFFRVTAEVNCTYMLITVHCRKEKYCITCPQVNISKDYENVVNNNWGRWQHKWSAHTIFNICHCSAACSLDSSNRFLSHSDRLQHNTDIHFLVQGARVTQNCIWTNIMGMAKIHTWFFPACSMIFSYTISFMIWKRLIAFFSVIPTYVCSRGTGRKLKTKNIKDLFGHLKKNTNYKETI